MLALARAGRLSAMAVFMGAGAVALAMAAGKQAARARCCKVGRRR